MSKLKRRTVAGIALALMALAIVRCCVWRPSRAMPGARYNLSRNAIWLSVDWVKDPHTPGEIRDLAANLERRQIGTVFVFVSYLKPGGYFNPTYEHGAEFVRALKAARPDTEVQAWIGLPLAKSNLTWQGYIALSDPAVRAQVASFSARLVGELEFDGVHVDAEPIPNGDVDVLRLLDDVRAAIGPGKHLSLAARRIVPVWNEAPLVPRLGLWQAGYYRAVAARVDEIDVMVYDSLLPNSWLYEQWVRFQVVGITRALAPLPARPRVLIGVPTSEEETLGHRPWAENMSSGLRGVVAGLNDADSVAAVVTGVAIYPEWETSAEEWSQYDRIWLGK